MLAAVQLNQRWGMPNNALERRRVAGVVDVQVSDEAAEVRPLRQLGGKRVHSPRIMQRRACVQKRDAEPLHKIRKS